MANVSFPQINTYPSRFPNLDFSSIANLPNAFWQGQEVGRENKLRSTVADILKNGGSWEDVRKAITASNPIAGAKLEAEYGTGASVYGTPIYTQGPNGEIGVGTVGKQGTFVPLQTPEGLKVLQPQNFPDLGNVVQPVGRYSGQPTAPAMPKTGTIPPGFQPAQGGGYEGMPGTPEEITAPLAGRKRLSDSLGNLTQAYQRLDALGGIVNPDKPITQRVGPALANTPLGQTVTGRLGTEAGSLRNRINTIRPALVNTIRQVTGMSARAMDSNVELQFYLQQATDPGLDIYTNYAAIDALDKAYGLGGALKDKLSPQVYQKVLARREELAGQAPQNQGETPDIAPATQQGELPVYGAPQSGGVVDWKTYFGNQ